MLGVESDSGQSSVAILSIGLQSENTDYPSEYDKESRTSLPGVLERIQSTLKTVREHFPSIRIIHCPQVRTGNGENAEPIHVESDWTEVDLIRMLGTSDPDTVMDAQFNHHAIPEPGDIVVPKPGWNAMLETTLPDLLNQLGVTKTALVGVTQHICIPRTAKTISKERESAVLTDCTASNNELKAQRARARMIDSPDIVTMDTQTFLKSLRN